MEDMKKYTVFYASGATGYGWIHEHERLNEFEGFINEKRQDVSASVQVYDNQLGKPIFWKDCGTFNCYKDMLKDYDRDCRTVTRKHKTA